MRRTLLALSTAVACLISPLAWAEAPAQEEPAPAQGESKIFGPAGPSREEQQKKREDIRKLFTLMKKEEFANLVFARFTESMRISMPDVPDEEFWIRFREELKPSELVRMLVPIFDGQFNHDEILELIAFYESPIGQKVITVDFSTPDVPGELWTRFRDLKPSEFKRFRVSSYDGQFSHEDILELSAFYESPIGQKVIQVDPVITKESMKVGQALGARITKKVLRDMKRAQRGRKSR